MISISRTQIYPVNRNDFYKVLYDVERYNEFFDGVVPDVIVKKFTSIQLPRMMDAVYKRVMLLRS